MSYRPPLFLKFLQRQQQGRLVPVRLHATYRYTQHAINAATTGACRRPHQERMKDRADVVHWHEITASCHIGQQGKAMT